MHASHQVTDIPTDIRAHTIQHDRHAVTYACGQVHVAPPPDGVTGRDLLLFRRGVTVGLSQVRLVPGPNEKQQPARLLRECLCHRKYDVLRFLTDLRIPPTSNQAERDPRPAKTQQKIFGRLTSERAARDRYAIRGYLSTAAKHGTAIFTAILGALTGNPWMPPIPQYAGTLPASNHAAQLDITQAEWLECITGLRPSPTRHARAG